MIVTDAIRIRVLRAILGLNARQFAQRLGVRAPTLYYWERGRRQPRPKYRDALAQLCADEGIAFLPNGFPIPFVDTVLLRLLNESDERQEKAQKEN